VEQLNPVTRFVIEAMSDDHRIPAKKVPDVEPIEHLHHGHHVPEEHSVEQVPCGVKANTAAHCGSSVGRHDVPEGHHVEQVARGGEAAGGGVEVQERAGGVGRRGKEEAAAEELCVERKRRGEVVVMSAAVAAEELRLEREHGGEAAAVAVERRGGKDKASGKPEEWWDRGRAGWAGRERRRRGVSYQCRCLVLAYSTIQQRDSGETGNQKERWMRTNAPRISRTWPWIDNSTWLAGWLTDLAAGAVATASTLLRTGRFEYSASSALLRNSGTPQSV
jgi:hypothetical protein